MAKYADDCYLLVPASLSKSIDSELAHITSWAATNNLKLNRKKTQELIVYCSPQKEEILHPNPVNPESNGLNPLMFWVLPLTIYSTSKTMLAQN